MFLAKLLSHFRRKWCLLSLANHLKLQSDRITRENESVDLLAKQITIDRPKDEKADFKDSKTGKECQSTSLVHRLSN